MFRFERTLGGYPTKPYGEYPIDATTSVELGAVVKLDGGKVIPAARNETGAILGVAAESHSGKTDPFNSRSNGAVIAVYDDPNAVYATEMVQKAGADFYPTIGELLLCTLDEKAQGIVYDATEANNVNMPFVVVGNDKVLKEIFVTPILHVFGAKKA